MAPYEPNGVGLCAQGIFQAFSGLGNSLTGFGKLNSPLTLNSYKMMKNNHDSIFRAREPKLLKHNLINYFLKI